MDAEGEFIRRVLGPAVHERMERIERVMDRGSPVPRSEWVALIRALTARRDMADALDSPVGRAVITELLRRATYAYAESNCAPRPAYCGPVGRGA